ncbi:MAG: hypothetical protein K2X86_07365 [Cytophagaceae bacterium]|nr:hypothetical protein [Cytophagaceae bacterium]
MQEFDVKVPEVGEIGLDANYKSTTLFEFGKGNIFVAGGKESRETSGFGFGYGTSGLNVNSETITKPNGTTIVNETTTATTFGFTNYMQNTTRTKPNGEPTTTTEKGSGYVVGARAAFGVGARL